MVTCLYALAVVAAAVVLAGICAALAMFLEYIVWGRKPHCCSCAHARVWGFLGRKLARPVGEQDFEDECTVCLVDFTEGGQVRKLDCHHRFHVACIRQWRQTLERQMEDPTCPLCRAPFSARKKRRVKKRTSVF